MQADAAPPAGGEDAAAAAGVLRARATEMAAVVAAFAMPRLKRCGECRACAHPAWKQRCERNAAAAAAAGIPQRRKKGAAGAAGGSPGGGGGGAAPRAVPSGPAPKWPVRPKRPRTAFLLFAEGHHRSYRSANPGAAFAEVAEKTGQAWKALPAEGRAPFEAQAAEAATAHAAASDAFRAELAALLAAGHSLPSHLAPKRRGAKAQGGGDSSAESSDDEGGVRATRWEECVPCARWVVVADGPDGAPICADCRGPVTLTEGAALESWVQCDACGKWREVSKGALRALAAQGEHAAWTCAMRRPGATCKSGADDWGAKRRRIARTVADGTPAAAGGGGVAAPLADRHLVPEEGAARTAVAWAPVTPAPGSAPAPHGPTGGMHGAPCGGVRPATRCEFVPGRDTLLPASLLAAGLDAHDARTGELLLFTAAMPREELRLGEPFVNAAVSAYYAGRLPELRDGRESAGLVDLPTFLAEPRHAEAVEAALFRRRARRAAAAAAAAEVAAAAGLPAPPPDPVVTRYCELNYVVHVKHNQRAVYIGEEGDLTSNGNSIMSFNKSWKSCTIRSWSGGTKMADMPGATPNKLVRSKLSLLLADFEPSLLAMAARAWDLLASHPQAAAAAARQRAYLLGGCGGRARCALGATGWNAYSFNLDYATAAHYDSKNVGGSYSALCIFETGDPFSGSYYMLPQFRMALDVRQGVVLFHRSGDAEVGMHANSGLHCPEPRSHRIAVVLYLTEISERAAELMAAEVAAGAGPAGTASDDDAPLPLPAPAPAPVVEEAAVPEADA
jgi:hypothetical protein